MRLGETIYRLRTEKGMSQGDLAEALSVSRQSVSKWENNYSLPDILMLCALADYFGITTDHLLGRDKGTLYAYVAAPSEELVTKTAALAKEYGIETLCRFDDFAEAVEAANADPRVTHLLVCCEDARFSMENMDTRDDLKTIVSLGNNHQDILNGFSMMLRG